MAIYCLHSLCEELYLILTLWKVLTKIESMSSQIIKTPRPIVHCNACFAVLDTLGAISFCNGVHSTQCFEVVNVKILTLEQFVNLKILLHFHFSRQYHFQLLESRLRFQTVKNFKQKNVAKAMKKC